MNFPPELTLNFILSALLLLMSFGWGYTIHVLLKAWEKYPLESKFPLNWRHPIVNELEDKYHLWPTHIWKDRHEHPENVETVIAEVETRAGTYMAKRRKRDSDRQRLLVIVDEDGGTITKFAGWWFSDEAIRKICQAHSQGRSHNGPRAYRDPPLVE
jgi:hypothetical protein